MGIWLELGIFVVVLIWGLWQIRDARQAHARSVAERLARQQAQAGDPKPPPSGPVPTGQVRPPDHPAKADHPGPH